MPTHALKKKRGPAERHISTNHGRDIDKLPRRYLPPGHVTDLHRRYLTSTTTNVAGHLSVISKRLLNLALLLKHSVLLFLTLSVQFASLGRPFSIFEPDRLVVYFFLGTLVIQKTLYLEAFVNPVTAPKIQNLPVQIQCQVGHIQELYRCQY